ncbi:MAG: hypothetical protein OEM93_23115, partial [Rhodospirillales bacterium]|nr:hypothetical protein [Rhodospirillales bacterium]
MTAQNHPPALSGPPRKRTRGLYRPLRSLISKILLLLVVFIAVPVFLYNEFRDADREQQGLLLESVREQGRLMTESLRPLLEQEGVSPLL